MSKPGCDWCHFGDHCGVDQGHPISDCPVVALEEHQREPTNADIVRLLTALMAGVNQRFAQVMLLIDRHKHKPDSPGGPP